MHVHIHVYNVYIHACAYTCVYVYIHACAYTCMCIYMHVHIHACIIMCICACIYMCICVYSMGPLAVEELKRCASIISKGLNFSQIGVSQAISESPERDTVESVDALIREISDHIGRGWMVLARSLQFTEIDIDSIEHANERDLKEQIHQFFSRWKRRDGQEATRDMLYTALYDGELNELLKKLDKTDIKKSKQ